MTGYLWGSSFFAAAEIGISELKLCYLRENGFLKPGIHWKSSPHGQEKPWNPEVLYNIKECLKIVKIKYSFGELEDFAA